MFVFGYGSLSPEALTAGPEGPQIVSLAGFVRVWNVAMDNAENIPEYKYYVDPLTRERPGCHVTFLNLTAQNGIACVGFLLPTDAEQLAHLDARERNYTRVDVSHGIRGAEPAGPVYAYFGTRAARERFATGVSAGSAVVARDYLDDVERRFDEAGLRRQYRLSTRSPECRVADLTRVNLPGTPDLARAPAAPSAPRTARPDTRFPRR